MERALCAGGCWDASSHAALAALQPLSHGAPHPAGIPGPLYLRGPRRHLPAWPLARRPPGSVCSARVPASAPRCYASNAAAARPRASAWSRAEVLDLLSSRGEETAQGLAAGATCPAWRGRVWHRFWHTRAGGSAAACTPAFRPVPSSSGPSPLSSPPSPVRPPSPSSLPSSPIPLSSHPTPLGPHPHAPHLPSPAAVLPTPLLALCPAAPGVTAPTAPRRLWEKVRGQGGGPGAACARGSASRPPFCCTGRPGISPEQRQVRVDLTGLRGEQPLALRTRLARPVLSQQDVGQWVPAPGMLRSPGGSPGCSPGFPSCFLRGAEQLMTRLRASVSPLRVGPGGLGSPTASLGHQAPLGSPARLE